MHLEKLHVRELQSEALVAGGCQLDGPRGGIHGNQDNNSTDAQEDDSRHGRKSASMTSMHEDAC